MSRTAVSEHDSCRVSLDVCFWAGLDWIGLLFLGLGGCCFWNGLATHASGLDWIESGCDPCLQERSLNDRMRPTSVVQFVLRSAGTSKALRLGLTSVWPPSD